MPRRPMCTAALSVSALAIAKKRHLPYSDDQASDLWGLALRQHNVPVAVTWGHREVPTRVLEQLANRFHGQERSGQVIEFDGRQYFAIFHHTATHCALISDCCARNEPYLSLVLIKHLQLPDRRG